MKRTKLSDRQLPDYSRGEEIMNMVTHIVGGAVGVVALTLCVIFAALHANPWGVVTSAIYGSAMVTMFTISSVYHGLKPTLGKKVMQVIDHCTIYFLIAGTYTVILLSAIRPENPVLAWVLFGFEWGMVALATTLTAIDLKTYRHGLGDHLLCKAGNAGADLPGLSASAAGRHCLHGRLHSVRIGQAQEVDALRVSHFRRFGGAASVLLRAVLCNLTKKIRVTPLPGRKKPP